MSNPHNPPPLAIATPSNTLPAPTGLIAFAGPQPATIQLAWNPVTGAGGYQLKRNGVLVATTQVNGFIDGAGSTNPGLVSGQTYTYTVVAIAQSPDSAPASATAL